MKQTLLLMVLALGMCSINVCAQTKKRTPVKKTMTTKTAAATTTKERQVGSDGYIWYKLKKGNLYGAQDIDGRIIIPVKYNDVYYSCGQIRYFHVELGDYEGIYTRKGKLIISTDKHFTFVYGDTPTDGIYNILNSNNPYAKVLVFWFAHTNDGNGVILDAKGREVISSVRNYPYINMVYDEMTHGTPYYFKMHTGGVNPICGICDLDGQELLPMKYRYDDCKIENGNIKIKVNGEWITEKTNYQGNTQFDYNSYDDLYNYSYDYSVSSSSASSSSSSSTSSSSSSNSSNSNNSGGGTTKIVVEHQHTPQPVQQWQACFGCGGMGTMGCDNCGGSGTKYIGDRLHRCSRCNGRGIIPCNVCYGNKGQYITVYK